MGKKKKVIYDTTTEDSLKRERTAISMINGKLLNKNLNQAQKNTYEAQLNSLKILQKSIKSSDQEAIAKKFTSSVNNLISKLEKVDPNPEILSKFFQSLI